MDPLFVLLKSLQSVFDLEALRQDKYVFPPVQALKNALDQYQKQPENNQSYVHLLEAIVDSRPFIEKWRVVNFNQIKECMNQLAKKHQMPSIDWESFFEDQKMPYWFNFKPRSDKELIPWLEAKGVKGFSQLNLAEQAKVLVAHVEDSGFSKKFTAYLRKNPDFLLKMSTYSEHNFVLIAGSRLNLYLNDKQLADSITHYCKGLIQHNHEFSHIDKLIDKLNTLLSNGRSVTTIMRHEDAKEVLEDFFSQTEEKQNPNQLPIL